MGSQPTYKCVQTPGHGCGILEPMLSLRSAVATDTGPVRRNNEDAAYAGRRLAAVADGIGGLPDGELASEIAIDHLAILETAASGAGAESALAAAVDAANDAIGAAGNEMGTTVTAVLLVGTNLSLVHVGDSRGYLLAAGAPGVVRLTRDDTFVQAMVDRGALTAEEARDHPRRSLITQALQGQPYRAATATVPVEPGDRVLLCSDGLSDYLDDTEIDAVLRAGASPDECARELVARALAVPTNDNVTAVVADVV
jgi:protein phosphatase